MVRNNNTHILSATEGLLRTEKSGLGKVDLSSPSGRPVGVIERPEAVHAVAGAGPGPGEHQLVAEALLLPLLPRRGHARHGQAAAGRGHGRDWGDRTFDLSILLLYGRD